MTGLGKMEKMITGPGKTEKRKIEKGEVVKMVVSPSKTEIHPSGSHLILTGTEFRLLLFEVKSHLVDDDFKPVMEITHEVILTPAAAMQLNKVLTEAVETYESEIEEEPESE